MTRNQNILFFVILGIVLFLISFKGCEKSQPIFDKEKADLAAERDELIFQIEDLCKKNDSLIFVTEKSRTKIVQKKETIKVLREKVVIHDTLVVKYTSALESQILEYDTLVTSLDSTIKNLGEIVKTKDELLKNKDENLVLQDEEIEHLEKIITKKDRKIKILKIERVLYPAAVLIGGILLILNQ